jgi:Cytochrome c554 and c-prime
MKGKARVWLPASCAIVLLSQPATCGQGVVGRDWNPVEGPPAGAKYVGEKVCRACHAQIAKSYMKTPMARAGARAADTGVLRAHSKMTFHLGPYHYQIVRKGDQSTYSVTDGKETISVPIIWAFGEPVAGQTYVVWYNGAYYESRVSFYTDIQGLGTTLGGSFTGLNSLEQSLGERQNGVAAQGCISCHTTGAVVGGVFQPVRSVGGVSCEASHGPGAQHVAAVQQGGPAAQKIFDPARLAPYQLANFCGSCHRTAKEVETEELFGLGNVRFQPYRLELSACWNRMDPRISCLACHDPHKPLVEKAGFYDSKCLACHLEKGSPKSQDHPGAACPVSTSNCISCHMPRYELPGAHFKFIDHNIRVVRAGESYPW